MEEKNWFLFKIYKQRQILKVSAESFSQDPIITCAVDILLDNMHNFRPAERKLACTE